MWLSCHIALSQEKPNIILIMADDLGYETLSVNGGSSYSTPNLDQLALGGMRFDQCYATPLCTPSRVQIMTGKYNNRNYIGFGLLDPSEKTFGHYLQDAGYENLVVGKWQLLGNSVQQKLAGNRAGTTPEKAGFDDYCLWQINTLGSRYKDPTLSSKEGGVETHTGKYGPDIFVEKIFTFIEKNKNDPFFIYYPMVLAHDPFVPTPSNPEFLNFDAKSGTNDPKYFGEMVAYMDHIVGKLVQKVDDMGIRENTLILFVGDNGTDRDVASRFKGSLVQGKKGYTTNAGTHVPLIANWPRKIAAGMVNKNLIDFTDFLPTLLQVANVKEKKSMALDGVSFYPQLLGDNSDIREWVFCHYDPNWGKFKPQSYVQNKKWKLYDNGDFFNLEQDKLEKNPIDISSVTREIDAIVDKFKNVLNTYNK
ncbi:sulfatase-like hydrolase/transferase [Maribacter ulvicola]|nr:sulfatase-like hydrolase/transferase [Maribacter ulvicola]